MKKTTGAKFNVYDAITEKVITALEAGVAPWKRPWSSLSSGEYRNAVTGRHYRGLNILMLNISSAIQGFTDPRWLTYKNAIALKGNVKKGEKGTQIVFWNFFNTETELADGTKKIKQRPFARAYTVFNVQQTEGIDFPSLDTLEAPAPQATNEIAEKLLGLATVYHGGPKAFYTAASDTIGMPDRDAFESLELYYSTACHELVHWTGHKGRLDRDLKHRFGSKAYAFEELVAEMGSAFVGAQIMLPFDGMRHPEYIASWLECLKEDNKAIFTAASKAQAA